MSFSSLLTTIVASAALGSAQLGNTASLGLVYNSALYGPAQLDPVNYVSTPTQQLGGNSPWYSGPNVFNISSDVPATCVVDTAAFVSRHGSRYPDQSAYNQWTTLHAKIQAASYTASGALSFLPQWNTVLQTPSQEISAVSQGGWKELYNMGIAYRQRYPTFYVDNTNFTLWANQYPAAPRVIDSARLFARGYMGPNATQYGNVIVLPSTSPLGIGNSLAPSDSCPNYIDDSGGINATNWNNVYLPVVTARLNALLTGNLTFSQTDVSIMPYLCGFETQIVGRQSPWCSVFNATELAWYEYAQDLRYYYGDGGPGSIGKNGTLMLPVLNAIVQRLRNGPNVTYTNSLGQPFTAPALIATFTNDGEINQLASEIGVFDNQTPLPSTYVPSSYNFVASRYVSMKGTISFERLNCSGSHYIRVLLNDAVYPVVGCTSGPGNSCPIEQYAALIANKTAAAGSFASICGINTANSLGVSITINETASFLRDNALPFQSVVRA